jgi:hypothetical protein
VPDKIAADFAVEFYRHALDGQPLGDAMLQARSATAGRHPTDLSWASFVLYGDPGFTLGPFPDWTAGGVAR